MAAIVALLVMLLDVKFRNDTNVQDAMAPKNAGQGSALNECGELTRLSGP